MSVSKVVLAHEHDDKVTLGFWAYLMTDCLLFASLFATYMVMQGATAGGPATTDIFEPPFVLVETFVLLVSSFTCGMAIVAAKSKRSLMTITMLAVTIALGLVFLGMELHEFSSLIAEGYGPQRSGFLSAFFTLVGTHGFHISVGLLWAIVMVVRTLQTGLTASTERKLVLFSLFWHFLDLIWIFIFTIVYMMGVS